ncbi:polymorphic toxin-type HINT domain-containing protein [Paludisphaera mucosa]|uniref:Polymorphic toxin-type HINT domain-containing protein n=1 Tax=Paludisphaera mucosa TaxID=3030827 RepID=A0ABT6FJP9_9BACT|nr:polymorphic toxin-type HINT domain-containing protein [Paludisphaera mucosa]MDG3007807.1 polymorphic toxin-type HINT domain-containing protein [Paludisphaera mucosa]
MAAWSWILAIGVVAAADESAKPDLAAYEAAKASAGRDAEAQVRLALWCESRGMAAERTTHLMRAVLIDPENAAARGLLGQVKRDGRWLRADDVARAVEDSPAEQALLQEYLDRRTKARDTADGQYRLALWCEEKGLSQPMVAHLRRVVQLDPGRVGAWRRLGFEKVKGRWVDPQAEAADKAAREAQAAADKEWRPRLLKLRAALAGRDRAKRDEARAALAAIDDPRAVPAAWKVFAQGGNEADQRVAVALFGRTDGPAASTALATLAVFGPHAAIRANAAALLQRRDPREFAGFLAGLIRKEVKYWVKPVEGPGSQGELLVAGEDANVRRLYTPLAAMVPPGTAVDPNEVIMIPLGGQAPEVGVDGPRYTLAELEAARAQRQAQTVATLVKAAPVLQAVQGQLAAAAASPAPGMSQTAKQADPDSRSFQEAPVMEDFLQVPIGWMVAETRYSAQVAQQQLLDDVRAIEARNAPVRDVNERSGNILKAISGRDFGDDGEKWAAWTIDLEGYAYSASPRPEPPTYVEDVPLAFAPQAGPAVVTQQVGTRIVAGHSCFAAGTPVRTLQGPRAIETIRPGDQVLAEDTTTGAFRYRAVVRAFHNPPNETFKVDLGRGESVVATGIHRFWKAGKGWVMARELKAGDRLRTVGGVVEVAAVEPDRVQPVFNLQLAGGDNFCVGGPGVVAHDNSYVDPVTRPFDGVPATAELIATSKP